MPVQIRLDAANLRFPYPFAIAILRFGIGLELLEAAAGWSPWVESRAVLAPISAAISPTVIRLT
ncbi:MAG: hypothetical protein E6230_12460 [Paenibacillus dendritiformis]|uniref:hypothetical protein n=1 Tax=uncultured Paenibacillus sp. TaxID=227322 RepID=UPI0025D04D0A|nr:hypothetical protein [uncultured Paenibacillus sp.]MDU5142988.1 hypothetical protein [Paenibacillus dendritiformis]